MVNLYDSSLYIILDHIFEDKNKIISKINNLLSLNIVKLDKQELTILCFEIKQFYKEDVQTSFDDELYLWQEKWKNCENTKRPTNSIENLKNCNEDLFPSIFNILTILCVLPMTTTECERNFSSLKLIKSYLRSTMTNTRLNAIALHYIHSDRKLDADETVKTYMESGHRF